MRNLARHEAAQIRLLEALPSGAPILGGSTEA